MEIEKAIIEAVTRDDFATVASLKAQLAPARAAALTEGVDFDRLCQAICNHDGRKELSNYDAASEQDLARMILVRELGRRPARLGNLEANGVVVVEYGIPFATCRHPEVRQVFLGDTWEALVATLLDMLRTDGVCKIPGLGRYTDFVQRKLLGHPLIKSPRRGTPARAMKMRRSKKGSGARPPCLSSCPLGRSRARWRVAALTISPRYSRPSVPLCPLRLYSCSRRCGRARAERSSWAATVAVALPHPADGRGGAVRGRLSSAALSIFPERPSLPLSALPDLLDAHGSQRVPDQPLQRILEQIEPGERARRARSPRRQSGRPDKVEPWG